VYVGDFLQPFWSTLQTFFSYNTICQALTDTAVKYREVFNSLDEFTALCLTAAGVLPAMRRIQILPMNRLITFRMKGSN
jgi:hypothetical protein